MATNTNISTNDWSDYELLDSGENMKLERYGIVVVARPETQAIWKKRKPELWSTAVAEFSWSENKGSWQTHGPMPNPWPVQWYSATALARLTPFKHVGVFPEQAPNWAWTGEKIAALRASGTESPSVLNLFGYTGVASIAAAQAGAKVTHVDASKQSVAWAKDNAAVSGLPEDAIRWLVDDALGFARREVRRGSTYDGIILDPPAFGRGAKGEVWHIEEDLPALMDALRDLLSDAPGSFLILNGYAAGYTPQSFLQLVESTFGAQPNAEYGELRLPESGSDRSVSAGIYVRFSR
ncbi:MAG TPA: class I SAM-dependent methyltransferase [Candidatus Paceibacterota bacterium]